MRKPNELIRFRRNPCFLLCLTGCRAASCGFEIIPSLVIAWINPTAALAKHRADEIDLAPPTWVTLYELSRYQPTAAVLKHLASREPKIYETHVAERSDGVRVAMWHGDVGYVSWDPNLDGDSHRLVMARGGFTFENTVENY